MVHADDSVPTPSCLSERRLAEPRPLPATWRCAPVGPDKVPLIRDGRLDPSALDVLAEAGLAIGLDRFEVHATMRGAARKHGLAWRGAP